MENNQGFWQKLADSFAPGNYVPFLSSFFVLSLFLLFYRQWDNEIGVYFIPSLAIYSIGTAYIGYIHRLFWLRYRNDVARSQIQKGEEPDIRGIDLPILWVRIILLIHVVWLIALIIFNFIYLWDKFDLIQPT